MTIHYIDFAGVSRLHPAIGQRYAAGSTPAPRHEEDLLFGGAAAAPRRRPTRSLRLRLL